MWSWICVLVSAGQTKTCREYDPSSPSQQLATYHSLASLVSPLSDLSQAHALDRVILALLEDQARPVFGWLDVLFEIGVVDLVPDAQGRVSGLLHGEARETVEVG